MANNETQSNGLGALPPKIQGYATLFAVCLPIFLQYFQPTIDHITGQDEVQLQIMREQIDRRFEHMDSTIQVGSDFLAFIDGEMEGMRTDMETNRQSWMSKPFPIGLRAKRNVSDTLWYRATNGRDYVAIFDPFAMWWKYSDPMDWNSPHKAVLYEIDWVEFEEQQQRLMVAVMYYESLQN